MVVIAVALARSTSIPLSWTRNPKNFPKDTPKAHLWGFILSLKTLHLSNTFLNTLTWSLISSTLQLCHPHSLPARDALCHRIWRSSCWCTCIFQPEGHHSVVEIVYGCSKSIFLRISWHHSNLVISAEAIHKGEHGVSCCRVY